MTPESKATQPENQEQDTTMGWERIESTRHKIIAKQDMHLKTNFVNIVKNRFFSARTYYDYTFNVMLKVLTVS